MFKFYSYEYEHFKSLYCIGQDGGFTLMMGWQPGLGSGGAGGSGAYGFEA